MIDPHALFSTRRLTIIGVVAYLVFTLVTFPARLALNWFAPDTLAASGVSGTVWSGRANRIGMSPVNLTETNWRLRPLGLFALRLSYKLDAKMDGGAIQATASVNPAGTIRMKKLAGILPMQALSGFIPVGSIDGRIGLDFAELQIEDNWVSDAVGTIDIVSLSLVAPVKAALGSYEVVFDGVEDDTLQADFRDVSGPLQASGTLSLLSEQRWELSGTVRAKQGAPAQLVRGLSMLGARNSDGSYPISFSSATN
ncbi:MAG: type II secretion system protein N [Gammaproteobacteria bacterium]|nr:type II secretion system protein N [Gammaproteobacteria bacterium]